MEPLSQEDPQKIGEYTVIGRLGEGGMGVAYLTSAGPRRCNGRRFLDPRGMVKSL